MSCHVMGQSVITKLITGDDGGYKGKRRRSHSSEHKGRRPLDTECRMPVMNVSKIVIFPFTVIAMIETHIFKAI